jgi:GAF domain-containing protein/DNA-binding CsgD family transcriptional regulator
MPDNQFQDVLDTCWIRPGATGDDRVSPSPGSTDRPPPLSMSHHARRTTHRDVLNVDHCLESLQASGEFSGPVEPLDEGHRHHCNDHVALIHETREEQFAAVVPYLREGLETGERCLYVVEDATEEAVVSALRADGVDVDAAFETGQLSFHTVEETYLRNGAFRPDEMLAFYADAIDEATEEYAALRVAAETGGLLDETADREAWMEYESRVNELFEGEDCLALCQYDRTRLPAELLRDLVRTHPHLVYDGTVCHNFYYTPPEEFLGPERPDREVERMMRTLVERTRAKAKLEDRERYLRALYDVTADPDRSFEEQLDAVFELGCEELGLELGGMARIDPATDAFELEYVSDDNDYMVPGASLGLSEMYCRFVADADSAVGVESAEVCDMKESTACREFGVESYIGTRVDVDSGLDRALFFVGSEPREEAFTDGDRTLQHVTGQWVGYELDLRERERYLRRQNEITADPDRSFEEKLQALFELGCERFALEVGGMARVDPAADRFELEYACGDHEHFQPGVALPLSETFCSAATETEATAGIADPGGEGYDDITVYEEFGIRAYLGTYVEIEGEADRTFFFVSSEARNRGFSDNEREFLRSICQWVQHELEQRDREERLTALNSLNQSLMTAETVGEVTDGLVEAAPSLGLPATSVGRYDPEAGWLRCAGRTDRAERDFGALSPFEVSDGVGWEAFIEGETRRTAVEDPRSPTSEVVAVPLCTNGVLVTGLPAGERTDSRVEFVETVAASATTALDRVRREQQLHAREEELAAQNETLTRLDRINTTIRNIDGALVSASSRSEIESVVCERLTEAGPYEFAWVGTSDPVTGAVTPKEYAGDGVEFLGVDGASTLADRAVETRQVQVINDLLSGAQDEAWRGAALGRGFHAAVALPLVYEDTMFGVLSVFADQPGVFDDLEEAVLAELGDNIAHAINAVENKRSLVSNEVAELTFEVPAEEFAFGSMVHETGCTFEHEGVVAPGDGELRWFFSTSGAADEVLEMTHRLPVADLDLVAEGGDEPTCLFEARLAYAGLPRDVLEHGGRIHELRAVDGAATVTVDLHTGTGVREFVDMFRTKYAGAELVGKRDRERPLQTVAEFRSVLTEELTPRQREVLETAYYSGYFEEPRTRTGGEIAESMGVSQPTFTTHLRAAERRIYRELLEDGA